MDEFGGAQAGLLLAQELLQGCILIELFFECADVQATFGEIGK